MSDSRSTKAQQMSALLAKADRSSLSLAEFARRHDVQPQTLHWWRKRLKAKPAVVEVDLVPVTIVGPPRGADLEVEVGGATIRVSAEFDPEHLVRVVRTLRQC